MRGQGQLCVLPFLGTQGREGDFSMAAAFWEHWTQGGFTVVQGNLESKDVCAMIFRLPRERLLFTWLAACSQLAVH